MAPPGDQAHVVKIAILEQRVNVVDEKLDLMNESVRSIADDVSAIRLYIAENRGSRAAIKYCINFVVGLAGVVAGYFSFHK